MNTRLKFPLKNKEVEDSRQAMIQAELDRKKASLPTQKNIDLSQMAKMGNQFKTAQVPPIQQPIEQSQQPPKEDVIKLMTSTGAELGKLLGKPQGMRALAMFMKPDAAVLLNKKADEKEAKEEAGAALALKSKETQKKQAIEMLLGGIGGADIAKVTGLQEFANLRGKSNKEKDDLIEKNSMALKAAGAYRIKPEDVKKYPRSAIRDLGEGYIFKVKPKTLGAEAAAKVATSVAARQGLEAIKNDLKNNEISYTDISQSSIKGIKRVGSKAQKLASRLELTSEGLGRALSGAAVPEHEIAAFRRLFAINPLDTKETIDFKLNRSIKIIRDLENYMSYGGTFRDGNEEGQAFLNEAKQSATTKLNQAGGLTPEQQARLAELEAKEKI